MQTTSLRLNTDDWDICLDDAGNLATTTKGYAVAQDAACACLTFKGENAFDESLGIPWERQVLGARPSVSFVCAKMKAEAEKLETVSSASVSLSFDTSTRRMSGYLAVVDTSGSTSTLII